MDIKQKKSISWEIDISILTNMIVMKEILKVLGLATALPTILVLILWIAEGTPQIIDIKDGKYIFFLLIFLLVATSLFILIMGNKYPTRYEVNPKGVTFITLPKEKRKNKIVGAILFFLGLVKGNPTNMGIGMVTASRHNMHTDWKKVRKIVIYKKRMAISLMATDLRKNIIFCYKDNFEEIFSAVRFYCPKAKIIIKK